jgi:hypothetical protein
MPRCRTISISGSHRSRFTTGLFRLLVQSFWSQPSHQRSRKQLMTYVESLTTSRGPSRAFAASSTAISSMRWFVVRALAPLVYRPCGTAHAHPPGPGFPEHAPSVYTTVAAGTGTSSWSTPTSPLVSSVAAPCSPRGSNTCAGPSHDHRGCLRGANPRWAAVAVDRGDTGRLLEQGLGKVALCRNARCRPDPQAVRLAAARVTAALEKPPLTCALRFQRLPSSVVDRRPGTAWRPPEPSRPAGARAVASPDLALGWYDAKP